MTARWDTSAALTALLDALASDLLGAPKEEVQAALCETGRAKEGAVREIRSLLHDAEGDLDHNCSLASPFDDHDEMGTQRH